MINGAENMTNLKFQKIRSAINFDIIAIFLVLMLFASACNKEESKPSGSKETVTIGFADMVMTSPITIAQEKGFFAEEGLQVILKPYQFGKKAFEGMLAGESDVATMAEAPIMFQGFERNDFSVFATFTHSYNDSKVIARKDRGIIKASDLKGKIIGTVEKTTAHYFAYMFLVENRIDPATVNFKFYLAKDLVEAFKVGKVDAIIVFEPYAYGAQSALPGQTVNLLRSNLYRETFNLATMKIFAANRPETLKKILRSIDRASTYSKKHKEEAMAIIVKTRNFPKEAVAAVWDYYVFQLSLDNSMLTLLESEAKWAIKNRYVTAEVTPDYLDCYYLDAMKAVKPEVVSIVK